LNGIQSFKLYAKINEGKLTWQYLKENDPIKTRHAPLT